MMKVLLGSAFCAVWSRFGMQYGPLLGRSQVAASNDLLHLEVLAPGTWWARHQHGPLIGASINAHNHPLLVALS
jgi:hypothetical protein